MSIYAGRYGLIFGLAVAGWWLASSVQGLLPQLQMLLLGGRVFIPFWLLRALLLLAILVFGLRMRYRLYPVSVVFWWVLFCGYLFIEIFIHVINYELGIGYLVRGSYQYYFLLMIIVFAHYLQGSVDDRWMTPLLLVTYLPLGALGIAQYLLVDPIIPVHSVDGAAQVIAWKNWFYSGIRAFSLFRSPSDFGHYSALIAGLLIAMALRRGQLDPVKSLLVMVMLVFVLFSVYVSKGRIAYIVAVATILAAIWIAPRQQVSVSMFVLPIFYALVAYLVAIGAPQVVKAMGIRTEGLVFSDGSLRYRWEAWDIYFAEWFGSGWVRALFGSGLVQNQEGDLSGETGILIDNAFIAVGLHIGVVGLVLWLMLLWKLWCFVLVTAVQRKTALSLGVAAFWSTLPMSMVFSAAQPVYMLPLLLIFFERETAAQPEEENLRVDELSEGAGTQGIGAGAALSRQVQQGRI